MKKILLLAIFLAALAGSLSAQGEGQQLPVQTQIINLSLLEALVAIQATDLAGVFGFIPEDQSAMAMADYLMHNHRALKKFVKKGERDFKEVQGVNDWDKQVLLYLIGINNSVSLPVGVERIPAGLMRRINELGLAPGLPLQIMVQKRNKR